MLDDFAEYGTAISMVASAKYSRELLNWTPPRDMSSQTTRSSSKPGRRMHATKSTFARRCLRLFVGVLAGAGVGSVGEGLADTGVSHDSLTLWTSVSETFQTVDAAH